MKHRSSHRGIAAVEFLLCLPLLLLLALPVVDLARIFQANMILTNISREGASLISRSLESEQQTIMDSLAGSAPPLDMHKNGMIHITKILAYSNKGVTRNVVVEQYRWGNGNLSYATNKGVWNCGTGGSYWSGDKCAGLPTGAGAPEINVMRGQLRDGDVVYLVEAFYDFPLLFDGKNLGVTALPRFGSDLYAFTIL
jgi:Flp pilus assembly protein TadG